MSPKIKKLLRIGWTITKWAVLAGGAILITLKAPAIAVFVATLPAAAAMMEYFKDPYLTIVAGAVTSLTVATFIVIAPEVVALLVAMGMYKLCGRLQKAIALRHELERRGHPIPHADAVTA